MKDFEEGHRPSRLGGAVTERGTGDLALDVRFWLQGFRVYRL